MLSDLRNADLEGTQEADVCIVGGGAAGITLALALRRQGLSILLLESGGFEFEADTQALYQGKSVGHPYFDLTVCRLRMFGGTTNHWAGYCRPLDAVDFEERDWIANSGWPFGAGDLAPYYKRAERLCQLNTSQWNAGFWAERVGRKLLPIEGGRFSSRVFQLSPPTRFGATYRTDLETSDDVRVLLHANVAAIETAPSGDVVRSVNLRSLNGKQAKVSARVFVLAAGGIENARLLLSSRSRAHPGGIGNQHDLVGRFFMEHPHIVDGIFLPSDPHFDASFYTKDLAVEFGIEGLLGLREQTLRQEQLNNLSIMFLPTKRRTSDALEAENSAGMVSLKLLRRYLKDGAFPDDFAKHLGRVISDLDDIAVAGWSRVKGGSTDGVMYKIFFRTEQAPNPLSRITISEERDALGMPRVRLAWRLSESDLRTVQRGHELLARELGKAAIGRVYFPGTADDFSWTKRLFGGNHHMGTTRMHTDPRKGVVDAHGRVHDVENLYMAGSSVFPTCGYANPTLTIVALAERLADHLIGVLRA